MKTGITSYPLVLEKKYFEFLQGFVDQLILYTNELFLKQDFKIVYSAIRFDNLDEIEQRLKDLSKKIFAFNARKFLKKFITQVDTYNKRSLQNALRFTIKASDFRENESVKNIKQAWFIENLSLVKTIQNFFLEKVVTVTFESVRYNSSISSFKQKLKSDCFEKAKQKASNVSVNQTLFLNAQLTRQRKLDLGLNLYYWATAKDERVRKSHQVLEGKICDFNNPDVFKNDLNERFKNRNSINADHTHPGFAFNCRCTSYSIVT